MTLADKIVVMRDGVVEQVGAPLEVYDRPRNVFVAGFIGSPAMNFIEGNLADGEQGDGVQFRERFQRALWTPARRGVRAPCDPWHPARALRRTENGTPTEVMVVETTGSATQVMVLPRQGRACLRVSRNAFWLDPERPGASRALPEAIICSMRKPDSASSNGQFLVAMKPFVASCAGMISAPQRLIRNRLIAENQ